MTPPRTTPTTSARQPRSIRRKLRVVGAASVVSVLVLAGSAAHFALRTKAAAHLLLESGIVGTGLANRFVLLLQTHKGIVGSAPAELDRDRLTSIRGTLKTLNAQITAELLTTGSGPLQSASWSHLTGDLQRELPIMFETGDRVVALAYNFVQDQSLAMSQGPYAAASGIVLGQIAKWQAHQTQLLDEQVKRLMATSDAVVAWAYWGTGTALIVGLMGSAIVHGLLRRLRRIQRAMLQLARRDDAVQIPCLDDDDEIGEMARAVEIFQGNALMLSAKDIEIRRAKLRFETALQNMSQGLCQYDADARLEVVNQRFCEIYGFDPQRIQPGMSLKDVLRLSVEAGNHPGQTLSDLVAERMAFVDHQTSGRMLQELGDGRIVAIHHSSMHHGGWVATYEDVTDRQAAEAKIAHMARHDALTGLPNRSVLAERLEAAAADAGPGRQSAVLCLDLDHFKVVNDTLGHPVGDKLLRTVALRLKNCIRDGDVVTRLGGDEFAIVQATIDRPDEARLLAERIVTAIEAPFVIDGHQINIGVSIGLALLPGDGATGAALLKNADMAMYRSKSDGRGRFCFFEAGMDAELQNRRKLELDLRKGLQTQQFELYYQPLINLDRQDVSGFEALLRWPHPERGMVSPAEFIPVAEEIGLIIELGEWVIRRACTDAARWPDNLKVAVNLSPGQFRSKNLVPTVIDALASSGLQPNRLELEITESVLLQNTDATLEILHEFRSLGIRISMDDFGTGYSSLSYLRSFPFDKVKIDQSFIRDLSTRSDSIHIVRAIQSLCTGLAISTTAEGVETEEQLAKLRAEGCTEVQGYLFSPARPVAEIPSILRKVRERRRPRRTNVMPLLVDAAS